MNTILRTALLGLVMLVAAPSAFADLVNINKADAQTLQTNLTGVGAVKAKAIIEYREQNGPFTSLDDLSNVKGIGAATVDKNRDNMSLKTGVTRTEDETMPENDSKSS